MVSGDFTAEDLAATLLYHVMQDIMEVLLFMVCAKYSRFISKWENNISVISDWGR